MSIKIEQSSEKINSIGGLILIGSQLSKIKFSNYIQTSLKNLNKRSDAIQCSDILLSYIGLLCTGSTAFEDIDEYRNNSAFKHMLGIKDVPSAETLRQRLDSGYDSADLIQTVNDKCYYIIKRNIRQESKEYWFDHAKSHCDWERLREGKIRYTGFVEHIRPVQREDIQNINVVIEAFETTINRKEQHLLFPEIYINTFWTNLPLEAKEVIELYHQHRTSEQYHSELKTDMDVERLPSGKFETNCLVFQLAQTAYNLLRRISIDMVQFEEVKVSRRRIRTCSAV